MSHAIYYLAGFFDGEGSLGLAKATGSRGLQLWATVSQVDPRPLRMAQNLYGGSIRRVTKSSPHRSIYHWQIKSSQAERFLRDIRDHLIVKDQQVDLVLAWIGERQRDNHVMSDGQVDRQLWYKKEIERIKHADWVD